MHACRRAWLRRCRDAIRPILLISSAQLLGGAATLAQQPAKPAPQPQFVEKTEPSGRWRPLAIRSEEEYKLGLKGGEAEQHLHGMARSEANPDVIYLSHDVGGVWRSRNGGETWEKALDRGLFVRAGLSIEVDPVNPAIVLFEADNAWDWLASGYEGIFRSTNGGDDWRLVLQTDTHYDSSNHRMYRHNIAYDPASASNDRAERWYVAFPDHEIFRSEDGGLSWTPACSLAGHKTVYALYAHPSDGRTLYLASTSGLFVSPDQGRSIMPLGDLPAGPVSSIAVHPAAVYATVLDNGLYRSRDAGGTFSLVRAFDAARVFVNPGYPETVYLVGLESNTIITHDGGHKWITNPRTKPAPGLGREGPWKSKIAGQITGIAPNPKDAEEAVAFSRATLWKTVDGGRVFRDSSSGFNGYAWSWWNCGVAFDQCDRDRFAFFNCDVGMTITNNGGLWFERRNEQAWDWYSRGVSGWMGAYAGAIQPVRRSGRIVASIGDYFATKLMCSADEGKRWTMPAEQGFQHNLFISYHSKEPRVVYAGKMISADGGATFHEVDFGAFGDLRPAILGMCRARPDTVYAMSEDRHTILRSDDRGRKWRKYVHASWSFALLDPLPTFAPDPVDPDRIFTIDGQGDLAAYDGKSWRSGGVLGLAGGTEYGNFVRTVAVDPSDNRVIYAGMHATGVSCVWRSMDGGFAWSDITENLPREGMSAMAVNPHTGELFKGSAIGTWIYPSPKS